MNELLIVFVKNPSLGAVKTRLAKTIGDEAALVVYQELLAHTKKITLPLTQDKVVFYSDSIEEKDLWDGDYLKQTQSGVDLGARMLAAFSWAFSKGYEKVGIIGSDCYELDSQILFDGFRALDSHQVVLGPTLDGGYYFLGMNKPQKEFFKNKEWSTDQVAIQTLTDIKKLGLSNKMLQKLSDVDTEEDLPQNLQLLLG